MTSRCPQCGHGTRTWHHQIRCKLFADTPAPQSFRCPHCLGGTKDLPHALNCPERTPTPAPTGSYESGVWRCSRCGDSAGGSVLHVCETNYAPPYTDAKEPAVCDHGPGRICPECEGPSDMPAAAEVREWWESFDECKARLFDSHHQRPLLPSEQYGRLYLLNQQGEIVLSFTAAIAAYDALKVRVADFESGNTPTWREEYEIQKSACDSADAEIEKLKAERDHWKNKYGTYVDKWNEENALANRLKAEIEELKARCERLVRNEFEALKAKENLRRELREAKALFKYKCEDAVQSAKERDEARAEVERLQFQTSEITRLTAERDEFKAAFIIMEGRSQSYFKEMCEKNTKIIEWDKAYQEKLKVLDRLTRENDSYKAALERTRKFFAAEECECHELHPEERDSDELCVRCYWVKELSEALEENK